MTTRHHHPTHEHHDVGARVDAALELLRADGGRVTTGRRAVVHALMTAPDHHVTAEDVAGIVQVDHPDVHLSTVYRTLDALERLGTVTRLNLAPGPAVYHLSDHAHHHFVCDRCGTVVELDAARIDPWLEALEPDRRVGAVHRLTLTGRCADCADQP